MCRALVLCTLLAASANAYQPFPPDKKGERQRPKIGLATGNMLPNLSGDFVLGGKKPKSGSLAQAVVAGGERSALLFLRGPDDAEGLALLKALDARKWPRNKARLWAVVPGGEDKALNEACKGMERVGLWKLDAGGAKVLKLMARDEGAVGPLLILQHSRIEKAITPSRKRFDEKRVADVVKEAEKLLLPAPPPPVKHTSPYVKATLSGHGHVVLSLAFSSDSHRIFSVAALESQVRVWDVPGGKLKAQISAEKSAPFGLDVSRDGKRLATAGLGKSIQVWDAATGKSTFAIEGVPQGVNCVRFSPDGKLLAASNWDGIARVYDAATGKEKAVLKVGKERVNAVAWSPDGKTLAAGGNEGFIKLFDVTEGKEKAAWEKFPQDVKSLAFSPDGKYLASGSEKTGGRGPTTAGRLWEVSTGKMVRELGHWSDYVMVVAWSPDGKTLAVCGASDNVLLLDPATGKGKATLGGHKFGCYALAFSPDGRTLATGGGDNNVRVWDLLKPKDGDPKP